MSGWSDLEVELTRWAADGRRCPIWLRDDDAVSDTPALRQFLSMVEAAAVPVSLAVVAAEVQPSLPDLLAGRPEVGVLVHGWCHANHAPAGEKKSEFGAGRPAELRKGEAAEALSRLHALFGPRIGNRFVPVFVPPWNRMAADMPGLLAGSGYRGVSVFGARPTAIGPAGLLWMNTHVDLIDWHGSRSAVPEAEVLEALRREFADRRTGARDPREPIGLLTHHLVHDETIRALLAALLDRLAHHPALSWTSPRLELAAGVGG